MRYLKLLVLFLKSNLQVELEYRANFIAQAVLGVFWAGITFISVSLFFSHTDNLGGWRYGQALVIVGLFTFVEGVISMLLEPNLLRIVAMVRDGTMDFVLMKPVNSQFLASLRHAKFSGAADLGVATLVLWYAFRQLEYTPTLDALAQFALMFAIGLLIVYSIWLAMGACSFWFVKIDHMQELFRALWDTARFPVSVFSGALRIVLTFVLPIAFMTTYPAQAILGVLDTRNLIAAIVVGTVTFGLASLFWRATIRNYSSASS